MMSELMLNSLSRIRFKRLKSAWWGVVLIPLGVGLFDPTELESVIRFAFGALGGTLPFVVFAVLMVATLKATGAERVVGDAFTGREGRMIFFAALVGGLAPFCSCEVIPFIAGSLAVGVPLSAVMAFWLSSPLIDPPALLITASALGWDYAIAKTVAAVALGLLGGFGVFLFSRLGFFASPLKARSGGGCSSCGVSPFSGALQWKFWESMERQELFKSEALSNGLFLLKWLTLAYLLEALLITYVPAELIGATVGGDGFFSIVMGALVGAPAYLNSYAAPALVAGLVEQGMSSGAAMAFLISGAVSCVPAMAAVWSLVKPPVFAVYLGFGVSGAILFGALFQLL